MFINSEIIYNSFVFIPIKTYKNLSSFDRYKYDLYKKGGVYGIINISDIKTTIYRF
jgi:hypothetical protein